MIDEALLQIIKRAAREGDTELGLSLKNLEALPLGISQLTNLITLEKMSEKYSTCHAKRRERA